MNTALLLLLLLQPGLVASGEQSDRSLGRAVAVDLCTALEAIQRGDRLQVSVFGLLGKNRTLFDPYQKQCRRPVEPLTFVVLTDGFQVPTEVTELLEKDGAVLATFTGTLLGQPRPKPDILHWPTVLAYANRAAMAGEYGNRFRTQFVVEKITNIRPASESGSASWHPSALSPFPPVIRASLPATFPFKARRLGIYGDVAVEIVVKGGIIQTATVISAADRLLIEDTLANIKTWEFEPDVEAAFTTTFSYRFEDLPATTASVRVHAELPVRVEIIAPRSDW